MAEQSWFDHVEAAFGQEFNAASSQGNLGMFDHNSDDKYVQLSRPDG